MLHISQAIDDAPEVGGGCLTGLAPSTAEASTKIISTRQILRSSASGTIDA